MSSKCPGGHDLPNKVGKARCTPLYCAADKSKVVPLAKAPRDVKRNSAIKDVETSERVFSHMQKVRKNIRSEMVEQPPTDMPNDQIETYVQGRLVKLLPKAVAEVEYQLDYGDDKQRMEAARDVLDANGMRRRDAIGAGGQTIVLNIQGPLPWAQQPQPIVNGQVVTNGRNEKEQSREVAGSNQAALPNGGDDKH